jgi:DNA replication and repair protein RecF
LLRSLSFRDFRNLEDATWSPEPGANLIYGLNGAGKSSLLEAVYLATTTKSFRTSRLPDCRKHGADGFFLGADVEGDARVRLEVGFGASGKTRTVNGGSSSIGEHLEVLPVVTWTTRDTDLFHGPPSLRRQMVDRGLVEERVTALGVLSDYRRALEAKRAALDTQPQTLTEWNTILAARGAALTDLRADWIDRLEAAVARLLEESSLGFRRVELRYRPSPRQALEGEQALFDRLEAMAAQEIRRGATLIGPHRDDLEIVWQGRPVTRIASAGERKLLGLVLLMAEARMIGERHKPPLYLIDDLDAELDRGRVEQIWELLCEAPQMVATSSRKEVVDDLTASAKWSLEKGVLSGFGRDHPQGAR